MNPLDRSELESNLAVVLHDPVPHALMDSGPMLFAWSSLSGDLASLEAAGAGDPAVAGVRAGAIPESFSFEAEDLIIELQLDHATRTGTGQVLPPRMGQVTLRTVDNGSSSADVNVHGVFVLKSMPLGPSQLIFEGQGTAIHTSWFVA
jgi:hypothetical protein